MKKIMKSWATVYICSFALLWCLCQPVYKVAATITTATETIASQLITDQGGWQVLGLFGAIGDEPTDLAVDERTLSTIRAAINFDASGDGKIIIVENMSVGANAMRFRNAGTNASADHVYQIYSGALGSDGDCAFVKRGTLTFKTGSQASGIVGVEFADLLTVTNTSASSTPWTVANPGDGSELVAEAFIDLQGDDTLVIVPTTIDDSAALLGKFY